MATETAGSRLSSYDDLLLRYKPRPVTGEVRYRRALKQMDHLMACHRLSQAEEDLLQLLAALVMQYDHEHRERVARNQPCQPGEAGRVFPRLDGRVPADGPLTMNSRRPLTPRPPAS